MKSFYLPKRFSRAKRKKLRIKLLQEAKIEACAERFFRGWQEFRKEQNKLLQEMILVIKGFKCDEGE